MCYNFFPKYKKTKNYHQKHKEKLQKEAREKYQNPSQNQKDQGQKKA